VYVAHSPFVGGAERSLLCTVSALADSGYPPVVISSHGGNMLAAAFEIASACRFTRFRDDVWELLHLRDIVLVPSHVEPFGNVALEAGGAGRPVVASRVGGLPEIVRHEETGLLVPPHDAPALARTTERLLSDPSLRRRLGMAARQRVLNHFGLARTTRRLVDLYDEILAPSLGQR